MEVHPMSALGVLVKEVICANPGVNGVGMDGKVFKIDRKLVNDGSELLVVLHLAMVRELFIGVEDGSLAQIVKVY
jgi:hypothetical protein